VFDSYFNLTEKSKLIGRL